MSARTRMRIPRAGLVASLPVLALAGLVLGATAGESADGGGETPSAWEQYLERQPEAVDDESLGMLERRILHALTPGQAERFYAGADPTSITTRDGRSLAAFLADLAIGGAGMVYVPVELCRVFATSAQTAPVTGRMAADETRVFYARGGGTAYSDQGGMLGGCGIPPEAVAMVAHFRVVASPVTDAHGFLRVWPADGPEPPINLLDYEPTIDPPRAPRVRSNLTMVVELSAPGVMGPATGDFKVKTGLLAAHVRGDVVGYLRPIVAADVVGAGDADTLDGLDSTELALVSHTHDGSAITSGTVGEPYIDPAIARDDEVVDQLKAGDGAGSGFDADLLDGLHAAAFRSRPANVLLVDPVNGDYPTIGAALADIGSGLPAAGAANRYLVRVGDGTYAEQVTMKPFVDIEGKGTQATIVSAPSVAGPQGTLECADDAELRNLTVESTGGGEKAIAIRCAGTSPMLTHVRATATGATGGSTPENIGILNDGAGAKPVLTGVEVDASPSPGLGVVNQNGAMPTIRDSAIDGADSAIENRDTATAKVAMTGLSGGAGVAAPALQSSYLCVQAYDGGTLAGLNSECFPNTPPTAIADTYATLGNTRLEVTLDHAGTASAANTTATQPSVIGETTTPKTYRSVFENDTDAETADKNLLTASAPATSTNGGDVNMYADGTFEYTPPVGFIGADTFDYTVTDPGGLMDTGTVTVNVSSLIWYVDKDNGGTADGRSTTPFTSLAPLDGPSGAGDPDAAGQTIFVFDETTGATGDGIELENDQILHGQEIALAPDGFEYAGGGSLVAAGTAPTLGNGAADVVELASGNTVRGLDIAATAGRAIFGNNSAGATISEVGTTGTGSGTGVRFDGATGTIAITNLDISSSTGSGIDIQGGTASFTFDSACSIGGTGAPAFNVNTGSGNIDYDGTISQSNAFSAVKINGRTGGTISFDGAVTANTSTAHGIDLTSNTGASITFTGALDIDTTTGTGFRATGGGTVAAGNAGNTILVSSTGQAVVMSGVTLGASDVTFASIGSTGTGGSAPTANALSFTNVGSAGTFNGGAVTIADTGGTAHGIAISGGSADFDFTSATIASAGGDAINIGGAATGDITFDTVDIDAPAGDGIEISGYTGSGVDDITVSDGTIDDPGVTGVTISNNPATGGVNLSSLEIDDTGGVGVALNSNNATINLLTMTIGETANSATTTAGNAIDISGGAGAHVIGGAIVNTASRSVEVTGRTGGTVNVTATINDTGTGINVASNTGGSVLFSAASKVINTGAGQAVTLATNTGSAVNFTGGGLDIDTTSGTGFSATAGGTVTVTGAGNSVTTTGGGAVVIADTVIGGGAVTFQSISVNGGGVGSTPGIVLDDTGAGGFTVTGLGMTGGSGGTIQGILEDGIRLFNTDGPVSISRMVLQDIGSTASAAPGHHGVDGQQVDGGLSLDNVSILRVTDSAVHGEAPGGGSTTWNGLTITNSTLANSNRFHLAGLADGGATDEAMVTVEGISGTVVISNNDFDDGPGFVNLFTAASGTVDITVQGNTFDDGRKDLTGLPSVGSSGVRVNTTGSIDADIRIGDPLEANAALGNTFVNPGTDASIIVSGFAAGDSADVDLVISRNSVTVTDHTSPPGLCTLGGGIGGCAFDFPNGGIGVESRGTGTFEAIISHNTLTETQNSGGLSTGSLRVDVSGDDTEVIVRNNTLIDPWDGTLFIRADDTDGNGARGFVLVQDNVFNAGTGLIGEPGSGDDLDTFGFANSEAPFLPARYQIRNGATLDLTVINEDMVSHDTISNPGNPNSHDFRVNGESVLGSTSTFNLLVQNSEGPDGFLLRNDDSGGGTPSELNLSRGASADPAATDISVAQAASVLDDNSNTTGGGATTVNLPVGGTGINIVTTTPTLPVVSAP